MAEATFMKISEFSSRMGRHYNTLYKWFNTLEEKRVHYVTRDSSGERVFDELDLRIAQFIADKMENGYNMKGVMNELVDNFELRPFPENGVMIPDDNPYFASVEKLSRQVEQTLEIALDRQMQRVEERLDRFKEEFVDTLVKRLPEPEQQNKLLMEALGKVEEKNQQLIEKVLEERKSAESSIVNSVSEIQKSMQLAKEETSKSSRSSRSGIEEILTIKRIERKLREKAVSLWNQQPEDVRYRKVGFLKLGREENLERREDFIRQYIDDHFEEAVLAEANSAE